MEYGYFDKWKTVKKKHPNKIVFIRMAGFLETFGGDAEYVAEKCGITTQTYCGETMAGFPEKAGDTYLVRLGSEFVVVDFSDFSRFVACL